MKAAMKLRLALWVAARVQGDERVNGTGLAASASKHFNTEVSRHHVMSIVEDEPLMNELKEISHLTRRLINLTDAVDDLIEVVSKLTNR